MCVQIIYCIYHKEILFVFKTCILFSYLFPTMHFSCKVLSWQRLCCSFFHFKIILCTNYLYFVLYTLCCNPYIIKLCIHLLRKVLPIQVWQVPFTLILLTTHMQKTNLQTLHHCHGQLLLLGCSLSLTLSGCFSIWNKLFFSQICGFHRYVELKNRWNIREFNQPLTGSYHWVHHQDLPS